MFLALQQEEILFFCATFTASGFTGGQSCQKGLSGQGRFLRIARVSKKGFHGKASFSENPEFPKGLSRHGRFKLTIHWQNAEMFYRERTINGRVFPEMGPRKSSCLMWRDKLPTKLVVVDKEVSQSNDPEMDPRKSPCLTRRDKLPMSSSLATEPSVVSVALPQSSVWMSPKHSWWQSSYKVDLEPWQGGVGG